MNENIEQEFRDLFFTPILNECLMQSFKESGLNSVEDLPDRMMSDLALQSRFKARMAIAVSKKYTELGNPSTPDDMDVKITEKGIQIFRRG